MILLAKTTPWYRDHGLLAGLVFCAFVLGFNLTQHSTSEQITGTLAAAPILAAVLVEKARRVLVCTGAAMLCALLSVWIAPGGEWDSSQAVRIILIALCGLVGYEAARIRLRERSQLVGMRDVARSAQRAIMLPLAPSVAGLDAAVRYASATEYAYIGGDAYEAIETRYGLRLLVADARGKGLAAIRTSAVAIGAFREWAHEIPALSDVLLHMDASISRESDPEDFVTALIAEVGHGKLRYCSAGHPPPLLVRSGRVGALHMRPSPPLSMVSACGSPQVDEFALLPSDLVLLYTDGLTEARNSTGKFFPLEEVLGRITTENLSIDDVAENLISELRDFVTSQLNDDVAFVMLRQK